MSDYRAELYKTYVSTFKGDQSSDTRRLYAYHDAKLKPWLADLPRTARILELGCGPGYFLQYLKSLGFTSVRGIDISAEQIAIAKDSGCEAIVADVFTELQQNTQSFDCILALDFVEHFRKEELSQLGQAIANALKPAGRLILQTPNGEGLFAGHIIYGDLTHGTIFNESSIQQWLRPFGFTDFEFRETGPAARDLRGVLRMIFWKPIRLALNIVNKIANGKTYVVWTDNMIVRCHHNINSKTGLKT